MAEISVILNLLLLGTCAVLYIRWRKANDQLKDVVADLTHEAAAAVANKAKHTVYINRGKAGNWVAECKGRRSQGPTPIFAAVGLLEVEDDQQKGSTNAI